MEFNLDLIIFIFLILLPLCM